MSRYFAMEIRETETAIHTLSLHINDLNQDKNRLQRTHNRLMHFFEEFNEKSKHASKPSLDDNTWHEELANEFLTIRKDFQRSLTAISNEQLMERINQVEMKVRQMDSQIIGMEHQLHRTRVQLSYLENKQKEAVRWKLTLPKLLSSRLYQA